MTDAPDPGLTDLIAAHLVETVTPDGDCGVFILDCTCGAEVRFTQADLDAAPVDSTAGALHYMLREHVALVVEQHTNGRIAELEAELEKQKRGGRTIGKAIDRTLKWVIEASNSEDLIGDDGDGDWEIVWDRLFQLRPARDAAIARAEKAEATVARVGAVIEDLVQNIADDEKTLRSPNVSVGEAQELPAVISVQQIYLEELRAALEGEQQ